MNDQEHNSSYKKGDEKDKACLYQKEVLRKPVIILKVLAALIYIN